MHTAPKSSRNKIMFNKLKSMLKNGQNKAKGIIWDDKGRPGCVAGLPFGCTSKSDSYDNAFPDIDRIAESFAEIWPYAVDEQGRRLAKQPPVIEALYNPNQEMSVSDFLETLITMLLVHPLVHILVWHYEGGKPVPGGPVTAENIAGFTFLEGAVASRINGVTTFRQGDKTWTRQDVITLSLNVNPYQLLAGYSPSQAIKKWATTDDYIAEYQAAQFRNGGVPAGLITVTAPSVDAYNEAVDKIIAAHMGPQNANRVIYTHRPTSSIDGKPMAAGIEWTPFAQTNKDLTLDALFNQSNKKISMNFGVPEEIKGYLQNSNYASAEVADYVFSRYVLRPKLAKVYSKFTHEMNRVTGGIKCAITYDYELPMLTDALKVQTDAFISLVGQGFTPESSVEALRLPRSFLKLVEAKEVQEQNLQIDDAADNKPSQAETSKSTHEHHCEHCSRGAKAVETQEAVINPTLKALLDAYLAFFYGEVKRGSDGEDAASVVSQIKNVRANVSKNATAKTLRTLIIGCIYYQLALIDFNKAIQYAKDLQMQEPTSVMNNTELLEFRLAVQSAAAQALALVEAGESLEQLQTDAIMKPISKLSAALVAHKIHAAISDFAEGKKYQTQLNYLLTKFATENLKDWEKEAAQGVSRTEAIVLLQTFINNSQYRVNRWAITEQHRGEELGHLLAAEETGKVLELTPYKVWHTREGACVHCTALAGEKVPIGELFSNGNMVPSDHPNCRCYFEVVFEEKVKPVKVCCPNCGRYMMESLGGSMKNVICANSKCKKHYDIEVNKGKIVATERKKEE